MTLSFRSSDRRCAPAEAGDLDDSDLMAGVRASSSDAFERLLHAYWTPLVRYAARQLDDLDVAKDIVQDVFVQVWSRRTSWQSRGSIKAYLYTVARSLVIDERRRRRVRLNWAERRGRDEPTRPPTPVQLFGEAELQAAFEGALAEMPARRREVFDLVQSRGLSYQEVAAVMEISPQTVANQMSRALSQLRQAVQRVLE